MKKLLFIIVVIFPMLAMAHDFEKDGIYYKITSSTDLIVSVTYRGVSYYIYKGEYSGDVIIPVSVYYNEKEYKVTSIGNEAFYGCSGLTSVTIPNSVTSIGYSAFRDCSGLTTVTIPNSVTSIGSEAFYGCSGLTSLTIGNSVTSIEDKVFYGCSGLSAVTIPNSVTSIGSEAFYGCSGLTSVTIPNSVTSIGNEAFYGCSGLTSVTIPNSVTSIGYSAFRDCSGLTTVTIPNSVTSIGVYAFDGCINLPIYQNGQYADTYLVRVVDKEITSFLFKEDIRFIGDLAFAGCRSLTSVTIPNSVTSIGDAAFENCRGLTSVIFGNSVTSIGRQAFCGCSGLTSVTIPNSVTSIGSEAFFGCRSLTSVTIPNSVTHIGSEAFRFCSGKLYVNCNIPSAPSYFDGSFYGSMFTEVEIGNDVTSIGSYAFVGCSELTSVTIPNCVTHIESEAFYGCSGLTSVTIPNSVTYIGNNVFKECTGKLYVNCNIRSLLNSSYGVFSGSKFSKVEIGDDVTSIGDYAFYECSSLTSVIFGNSVTSIGDRAFFGCTAVTSIDSKATVPPTCGTQALDGLNKSECTLYVPKASIDAYKAADQWKDFLFIEANSNVKVISPIIESGSEITEQNAEDITEFKMNLDEGVVFSVNDGAKVELWIGGVLKGTAEKKDISEKDGIVTVKFSSVSANASARGMLGEFWNTVATSSNEDVEIQVKIAANSFKINNEDISEELSYSYTAKASVADKIENDVTALDEIEAGGVKDIIYNLNGSRVNGNTQKGIIIKNGNKVLMK